MDIDVPLDDVIAKKRARSSGRGGRGRGGRNRVASSASTSTRQKYSGAVPTQQRAANGKPADQLAALPGDGSKIVVSNLPDDVSEVQIRELFDSTVGKVKSVHLSYNSHGKSSGVATIEFRKAGDGTKAYQAYNNRLIDQKRPMKVEIIVDPTRIPPPPLASRVAPAPEKKGGAAKGAAAVSTPVDGEASPARRGGGGRRGRGGRNREKRPQPTAEELDAEMDSYIQNGTTAV